MPEFIPYGHQDISEEDIEAVNRVLRSEWLTQGSTVPAFEVAMAKRCGAEHAVAMNSATSALHIACLALGVGPGDRVWTSPITFVASANCARYCGADVDFVDIDPRTHNLCPDALERKLVVAERSGTLPKVVIPVHLAGQPSGLESIHALGRRFGFRIVEDASHAVGARYKGDEIGGCRYSDITVFSFHPVKIMTTGEGGMALTNNSDLSRRMSRLRTHGITREPSEMCNPPRGAWYYEQVELGYNYRMTDIQAALGLSQLARLDQFLARRREVARRYDQELGPLPMVLPWRNPDAESSWHLYIARLERSRDEIFASLRSASIGVNLHYIPVYRHPDYARLGFAPESFPNAESYYSQALSLPIYASLTPDQQGRVIDVLSSLLLCNTSQPARTSALSR